MKQEDHAAFVERIPELRKALSDPEFAEYLGKVFHTYFTAAMDVIEAQQAKLDAQAKEIVDLRKALRREVNDGDSYYIKAKKQEKDIAALRRAVVDLADEFDELDAFDGAGTVSTEKHQATIAAAREELS